MNVIYRGYAAAALVAAATLAGCSRDSAEVVAARPEGGPALAVAGSDRIDLGTLGGTSSTAYDINADGVVVGTSTLADGTSRAFRWTEAGGMVALPAGTIVARGVNAAGQITGRGQFGNAVRPFLWTPGPNGGTLKQLPLGTAGASGGEGRDVNLAGQVAGFVTVSGVAKAVLWTPDASAAGGFRVTHLGDFGGGEGEALAINASGKVVGWATESPGRKRPFRWTPSAPNSPTGSLQRISFSPGEAQDVNDAGQISGWLDNFRPMLWDPAFGAPILIPADDSWINLGEPRGISADGTRMAGAAASSARARAFARGTDALDLAAPAGASSAYRISPDGQWIVGMAGGTAALWHNVTTNTPPVASVGGYRHFTGLGQEIVMDAGPSTDPDGDPLTFTWLTVELEPEVVGTGPTWSHTPQVRSQLFKLRATDDDGRSHDTIFEIVANSAPVADIAGPDTIRIDEAAPFVFDASGSHDPDGYPLRFYWTMSDGPQYEQLRVNRSFPDNGTFAARLIVRDTLPAFPESYYVRADTTQATVIVRNVRPTATFPDGAGQEGTPRTLALRNAHDPSPADRLLLQYSFDCGDAVFTPFRPDSTYTCPAVPDQDTVVIRGRIRDKDGGLSVYTRTQYIANVLPVVTASASATTVPVGALVTIAAGSSFTDPGDDASWTWYYDWGDGVETRGGTSSRLLPASGHRYAAPGTYTLRVRVRDDRGVGYAAPITITVTP